MKSFTLAALLVIPVVLSACKKHEMSAIGEARISKYHCPMHPTFIKDGEGECAICGMDLVPIQEEAGASSEEEGVKGLASIKVDSRRRQLIGLKTEEVEFTEMIRIVRTVGRVAFDPKLYRTQEEFLTAVSSYERMKKSSSIEAIGRAKSLVESSRLRLRIMGLSDKQVDALAKGGKPERGLLLAQGKGAKPLMYADLYEGDLELVRVGQEVEAVSKALPGEVFLGEVAAIDSTVNPKTRTVRLRVRLEDPDGLLRPDAYLNARIQAGLGERMSIPDTAIIDTGVRQVVFVDVGDGHLEPREVTVGLRAEGRVEIREGLEEGERVVTSGNFLIDSESRLRAVIAAMNHKAAEAAVDPHAGHGH